MLVLGLMEYQVGSREVGICESLLMRGSLSFIAMDREVGAYFGRFVQAPIVFLHQGNEM